MESKSHNMHSRFLDFLAMDAYKSYLCSDFTEVVANIFVFVNINPFLYINDQFALRNEDAFF